MMFGIFVLSLTILSGFIRSQALAQAYPSKPVRLIVPYPAGGPIDVIARLLGQKLTENLGQQVIIDNRGGANGIIGVEIAARAAPDGYTFLMGSTSTHSINPRLYSKLPYDAVKDFAPVSLLATRPYILVLHPSVPAKSVNELIALARARPGQLTYASGGGAGSANHLAGELFKASAGVDIVHVPYKGGGPALTELLGGQVAIFFAPITIALSYVQAGKLRALAVTGARRAAVTPDLPTMSEAGLPGFEFSIWDGMLAPARVPKEAVAKVNGELVKILQSRDIKERFAAMGADAASSTPEQLAVFMKADADKWVKILKDSGARAE
jgi:tripartite-type tricarboxylate transporter receptor subunit TctC